MPSNVLPEPATRPAGEPHGALWEAIGSLPSKQRVAVVHRHVMDMTYAQIAEVLGASIPQVKTWLHRGRRQLARMLADLAPPGAAADEALQKATRRHDVERRA